MNIVDWFRLKNSVATQIELIKEYCKDTKDDIKYVTCPNASDKSKTCANCRLCTKFKREYVVVLPFHGRNPEEVPPDFLMDHV